MPGARLPSDHVADPLQLLRVGRIVGVDLPAATCIVEIDDTEGENVETAEIQWGTLRAGKTRIWSPPSEGEQVLLFCPNGDIAQAIPLAGLFSNEFPAPGNSERELIEFGDGAVIAYDPEAHHLDIALPGGATTRIESDGGVTIVGDVRVEGDILSTGTITGQTDVIADGISGKGHRHGGVASGAAVTDKPQ